ncbi:protein of unknown function [[Clostridium] ultunense Esp]|uniref:Uncharacterized protein n=1 Tax=[Clostridium] ultunense Esp TaxID=1288971 RepID=A0A1M4PJ40_9FIRM|nr:protein of unknown function [[Clostridium] ultunense Esp]
MDIKILCKFLMCYGSYYAKSTVYISYPLLIVDNVDKVDKIYFQF